MTIEDINRLCEKSALRWTNHIIKRLLQRGIMVEDVKTALKSGKIIEQYSNDYPFPSCLVLGYTKAGKPLHIVCGKDGEELWLITAYYPSPGEWTENFIQRRKV